MAVRAVLDENLKYKPPAPIEFRWQGVFENYSRAFVHRNFWRVRQQYCSEEDALQECALVFSYCVNKYGATVDEPKWMMALYKRALASHWHDASTADSRKRSIPVPDDEELVDFNHGPLQAALAGASEEAKQFISIISTAPADLLAVIFSDDLPQSINNRLKRICGIKTQADVLSELRQLLT